MTSFGAEAEPAGSWCHAQARVGMLLTTQAAWHVWNEVVRVVKRALDESACASLHLPGGHWRLASENRVRLGRPPVCRCSAEAVS